MFYDDKLMNSKTLGKVWKAANNVEDSNGDVSLPKICRKLDEWVESDEQTASRRLSLRTSAIFIDGAAKLYKQGIQKLFDDIDGLDKAMSARKRHQREVPDYSKNSTTNTSDSVPTPEKMMRRYSPGLDTSQINDIRTESPDNSERFVEHSPSICSNKTSERWTFRGNNNNIFIRDNNENSSLVTFEDSRERCQDIQRKEQEVQTTLSFAPNEEVRDGHTSNGFDENLPFGCILIHDNYRSRIPSTIIFSSINADVRNIF